MAVRLLFGWVFDYNGLLVGGTGYGLMFFILRHGKSTLNRLLNLAEFSESALTAVTSYHARMMSWKKMLGLSIPLGVLGSYVLWKCGYPLAGFARIYLAIGSMSIYFVGSFILVYYLHTLRFFMLLENSWARVTLKESASPMDIDSFNSFFVATSTLGILAIYFGFRGTLTAGFEFPNLIYRKLLILPIFAFLPAALMYSFYPRFILRKISDFTTMEKVDRIGEYRRMIEGGQELSPMDKLNLENTVLELREKLRADSKQPPILGIKDTPSLFITLLVLIQFILQKDSVVSGFFDFLTE